MNKFPLTHIYGVTRAEYYKITGTTPQQRIDSIEAKILVIEKNREQLNKIFQRKRFPFVSREGRYLASLIKHIDAELQSKRDLLQDIKSKDL